MADTGIFATTAEVIRKAGANASSVSASEAYINDYMTQIESYINIITRNNWSDAYSGLNVDVKGVLKLIDSNLAAMWVIEYDMKGFTSRTEAETMLDVLNNTVQRNISILRDKATETFMIGA